MGVNLYNENKLDEMSKIMKYYMKYVPTMNAEEIHPVTNESYDATKLYPLLFGGDYLTVA